MQFFKHDTNMIGDNKLQRLIMSCGGIAYAVYNVAIEEIGRAINENNQDCGLPTAARIIAHDLWENEDKVKEVLKNAIELGLLEGDENGTIYCKKILTRINVSDVSNVQLRNAISSAKKGLKDKNSDKITKSSQKNHKKITEKSQKNQENITTEKEIETEEEKESEKETDTETEVARAETDSSTSRNFAQQVFDLCTEVGIPNCKNNFTTFIQRDLRLALTGIRQLQIHSDELFAAIRNYGEVLKLQKEGKTWWERDLRLDQLCSGQKSLILNFLPDNFRIEDYQKEKPDKSGGLPTDRIRL